ncbi:MAG: 4-hydroxy-3-methylbut-2-enyl diphosphate reductase [PVC group bacterium]|nr:4-hydroxy-3-methylbut-2-enyl diphosphate reductase [PVC group bacterium]
MKINIAKSAGFCFGVKHALNIAFKSVDSGANIDMLGDIVHNEDVVKQISQAGIKKISRLRKGASKTLLIRAHGAPAKTHQKAKSLGYKIIDSTCPMVKEIHMIAKKAEKKGCTIIIVGDQKHDEVRGIIGQLKKNPIVIDRLENIPLTKIKRIKKAAIVVQSTRNMEKTLAIVETLKQYIANLEFHNTICNPTRIKQQEMKIMPLKNDLVIVVGSKTSANTKRLYELSKSLNKKSYWIQSKNDINPSWFKGVKSVGITSGASTPDETTKAVVAEIKKL